MRPHWPHLGSNEYEIWHVRQLDHAKKKVQNSFYVRTALHGANIFQIFFYHLFHQTDIWRGFSSHVQYIPYNLSLF